MFESMPAVATQQEERLVRGWGGARIEGYMCEDDQSRRKWLSPLFY